MKFVSWLDETVERAIILRYMVGTTAFEYLRNFLPLPCQRTLLTKIEKFKLSPGVCDLSVKFFKKISNPTSLICVAEFLCLIEWH